MNTLILKGFPVSKKIKLSLKKKIDELRRKNVIPTLVAVLVGDDPASQIYIRSKHKTFIENNCKSEIKKFDKNITENELINFIKKMNLDENVHGILIQLPLSKTINERKVLNAISPDKDVDGFHPINVGNLSSGYDSSIPCTPLGCSLLLKKAEKNLSGKHAVVIGRSNLNGKPMTQLLLKENCTVTVTHSKTKNLKTECLRADIIIAAVGIPKLVKGDW